MAANDKSNELKITRLYDAPVETVWDAWTDPAQAAQWWGPRGFTLTTHSKDLKVGGIWHYTMHGPDGTDYPNKTKYFEVEKHSRLVYDHGGYDERAPLFRVTVVFTPVGKKTRMEMTMALPTPEAAAETAKHIKKAGGNGTWDRLAEYLAEEISSKELFVINRTFDAPVETLFEMWTNPEHFSQWLPPTGMKMRFIRPEIGVGKSAFYHMTDGESAELYGRVNYLEIQRPDRIVYTQQFCDEKENVIQHPMAPVWPETMLTTVTLTAETADRTRVTVVWEPHGSATAEEIAAFVKARGDMTQGWTGSFDKLEELLDRSDVTS